MHDYSESGSRGSGVAEGHAVVPLTYYSHSTAMLCKRKREVLQVEVA